MERVISENEGRAIVAYQHDADEEVSRTHIHAMLENVSQSKDTLKRWVVECLGQKVDRSDWAFSTLQNRKFITYMSKGVLDPMIYAGITIDEINEWKAKWVMPTPKQENEKQAEKETVFQIARRLARWMDDNNVKHTYITTNGKPIIVDKIETKEIVKECIRLHIELEKTFCDFSLIRVIQTAIGISHCNYNREHMIDKIVQKLNNEI